MTILIDNRQGSGNLFGYFPKGLAELTRLEYADFAFQGKGYEGSVFIGVERKQIYDLVDCLISGRFSGHQLPGLGNCYNISYLIVEGIWRPNPKSGLLEVLRKNDWIGLEIGKRQFMAKSVYNYLNSLAILGGVVLWFTRSPRETVALVMSLYFWWTEKEIIQHVSHKATYQPYMGLVRDNENFVYRFALQLPGIGEKLAREVARTFPNVLEMVIANESDWKKIDGIGKKMRERMPKLLQGIKSDEKKDDKPITRKS